jgi:hypothetical protein
VARLMAELAATRSRPAAALMALDASISELTVTALLECRTTEQCRCTQLQVNLTAAEGREQQSSSSRNECLSCRLG